MQASEGLCAPRAEAEARVAMTFGALSVLREGCSPEGESACLFLLFLTGGTIPEGESARELDGTGETAEPVLFEGFFEESLTVGLVLAGLLPCIDGRGCFFSFTGVRTGNSAATSPDLLVPLAEAGLQDLAFTGTGFLGGEVRPERVVWTDLIIGGVGFPFGDFGIVARRQ